MKFPRSTQFTFGSLTFVAGEDGDLKMLPPGTAPEHPAPAPSSTSGGTCSGSDSFAGLYICTVKLVQGIPIVMSTLRPFVGVSSSSSSTSSPNRDSSSDYPDRGQHLRKLCRGRPPHSYGVPRWGLGLQQVQWISHY